MESDLSSSDAALRMLFVEDVELLERGIFRRRSLLSFFACPIATLSGSVVVALSIPLRLCCAPRAFPFFQTGSLFLWGHLFAVYDVKHANPAVINHCSESTRHIPTWSHLYTVNMTFCKLYTSIFLMFGTFSVVFKKMQ